MHIVKTSVNSFALASSFSHFMQQIYTIRINNELLKSIENVVNGDKNLHIALNMQDIRLRGEENNFHGDHTNNRVFFIILI